MAFIGRARELWELERALAAARAGRGSTALVAGEAGIGKTRLAAELAGRARESGVTVLAGRSLDLVGTELPYQPIAEALRPLGELRAAASQLEVFERALVLVTERAAESPVLVVLEDLHWADTSTLDLVVFLAHNLDDASVLLLVTFRADEPCSADRVRRLTQRVRRWGTPLMLELGPLTREELASLLTDRAAPPAVRDAIVGRADGNPFFAEELLAAARDGALPSGLRETLLERVAPLDARTVGVLRVAAAAGREASYGLLRGTAGLPELELRESLRRAVEQGVLLADQQSGSFRFRHALLAEAVYATVLPGEREELHGRLAEQLVREGAAAAELAPHWAAAGRRREALVCSLDAARAAESVFGVAEARSHVERALALWPGVPDAAALAGLDEAALCGWGADLAGRTGDAGRAVELAEGAIELAGEIDRARAALLHDRLASCLFARGRGDAALAASARALELVPEHPPSRERAHALAAHAGSLMLAWRHDASLVLCDEALAVARAVDARAAELQALAVRGTDLVYLGRRDDGLADLRRAVDLARAWDNPVGLMRAYANLSDVLLTLGRPLEAAAVAERAHAALQRYSLDDGTLVANRVEALVAAGEWDAAEGASAAAIRAITGNYPHHALITRAELEVGRGELDAARKRLDDARATLRLDRDVATYDTFVAELALWERRWADVDAAVRDGLARAGSRDMALIRVWLCAKGLRAAAELAALARAGRDAAALRDQLARAAVLITDARGSAAAAAAVTPNAAGWLALAEAEHERARGGSRPELWSLAAEAWERLQRPPLVAYARWRQSEALVAAGASRRDATAPLRDAHSIATRIGAAPLLREIELLGRRARLDPTPLPAPASDDVEERLGLTAREREVLSLLARGLTNREIADELIISAKTASVHVSHILRKLDAPNRREAAAIAHRVGCG
jgi:DNA-binding CsgD family transcriptional regulator/tetratricopeptide (TPR) repeat protein